MEIAIAGYLLFRKSLAKRHALGDLNMCLPDSGDYLISPDVAFRRFAQAVRHFGYYKSWYILGAFGRISISPMYQES